MTRLTDLYSLEGQSPWLDNVRRDWLRDGTMARFIADGVRGVTSNPTIFAKAITATSDYDEQLATLRDETPDEAFFTIAGKDIADTAALLAGVHESSNGADGFVSFEVPPTLADDTQGTIAAARQVASTFALPNLLVKVPATEPGLAAITALISEGTSVNVTLIFGLERYDQVIDAYLAGLESAAAQGRDLSAINSVASFFVSRVDTEVDGRLVKLGAPEALRGRAAVAQAVLAYEKFTRRFADARFDALLAKGARPQRPLWASTSTKNPAYPDLLYVDSLIGPMTVNTMPDGTIKDFVDHGQVARTIDDDVQGARQTLAALKDAGVSIEDVAQVLERQGVDSFADSYHQLVSSIEEKRSGS
jgi:transaldolase